MVGPNRLGVVPLPNLANAEGALPKPMPLLTDANGDLAVEPKALPNTGFSSDDSGFLAAARAPNELAPARDVPRAPKGEVDV
jgi:hypothetical protein